jgi:hypothetical protein
LQCHEKDKQKENKSNKGEYKNFPASIPLYLPSLFVLTWTDGLDILSEKLVTVSGCLGIIPSEEVGLLLYNRFRGILDMVIGVHTVGCKKY